MPKNASARLAAAGAGALALLLYKASKAARSRGISLRAYLALHAGVAKIIIDGARATQREDPAPLPARLRRLREIAFLASVAARQPNFVVPSRCTFFMRSAEWALEWART